MSEAGAQARPVAFRGLVHRAHHPGWAFDPLSGQGAALHGGRFNRPGRPALYTALTPEGAWAEAQAGFAFKAQPVTIVSYAVDHAAIADCTDPATAAAFGADAETLGCAWADLMGRGLPVPSWRLADRLQAAGAGGAIVPSFAPGGPSGARDLVFWTWGAEPPAQVRVVDDLARLPRDRASWLR